MAGDALGALAPTRRATKLRVQVGASGANIIHLGDIWSIRGLDFQKR